MSGTLNKGCTYRTLQAIKTNGCFTVAQGKQIVFVEVDQFTLPGSPVYVFCLKNNPQRQFGLSARQVANWIEGESLARKPKAA